MGQVGQEITTIKYPTSTQPPKLQVKAAGNKQVIKLTPDIIL